MDDLPNESIKELRDLISEGKERTLAFFDDRIFFKKKTINIVNIVGLYFAGSVQRSCTVFLIQTVLFLRYFFHEDLQNFQKNDYLKVMTKTTT